MNWCNNKTMFPRIIKNSEIVAGMTVKEDKVETTSLKMQKTNEIICAWEFRLKPL